VEKRCKTKERYACRCKHGYNPKAERLIAGIDLNVDVLVLIVFLRLTRWRGARWRGTRRPVRICVDVISLGAQPVDLRAKATLGDRRAIMIEM